MLSPITPYSVAVGQLLITRMEVVAESMSSRTAGLDFARLSAMDPSEALPHLLGESDEVWVMAARDILARAQIRSKTIARSNGFNGSHGIGEEALRGPNFVRSALSVWSNEDIPFSEKRAHIGAVRVFLEEVLLKASTEKSAPTTIVPPRPAWSTPAVKPALAQPQVSSGPIPNLPEAGLPFCNDLFDEMEGIVGYKERLAFVKERTRFLPQPFAMAQMTGGDKLGNFAFVNDSFLRRFRWTGPKEEELLRMSLIEWYHPEDRALFATILFSVGRMLLGQRPQIKGRPVRGLSGDFLDYQSKHPLAKPREEDYILYQGAGTMNVKIAFGIFTELPK